LYQVAHLVLYLLYARFTFHSLLKGILLLMVPVSCIKCCFKKYEKDIAKKWKIMLKCFCTLEIEMCYDQFYIYLEVNEYIILCCT
jgi:hypothetical protein